MDKLYFIKNGVKYLSIGRIDDHFYSGGYKPVLGITCQNILEKLQLLIEIKNMINEGHLLGIPIADELTNKIPDLFFSSDEFEMSHWKLLTYETLDNYDMTNCSWKIDTSNKEIILDGNDIKLCIQPPYENLYLSNSGEDLNESKLLRITMDEKIGFANIEEDIHPLLFMSIEQLEENHKTLDTLLIPIYRFLNENEIPVNQCNELVREIINRNN